MRGRLVRIVGLPLVVLAGLSACSSAGVQPGIVYSSGVPSGSGPGPGPYSGGGGGGPYYGNGPTPPPQQASYPSYSQQTSAPSQGRNYPGAYGASGPGGSSRGAARAGVAGGWR